MLNNSESGQAMFKLVSLSNGSVGASFASICKYLSKLYYPSTNINLNVLLTLLISELVKTLKFIPFLNHKTA